MLIEGTGGMTAYVFISGLEAGGWSSEGILV